MDSITRFIRDFFYCLRHVTGILLSLNAAIALMGLTFAYFEGLSPVDGIYFSYVTALAIGYGDITPHTATGQALSILVGLSGMILFGIIVGISTRTVMLMMHPESYHKDMKDKRSVK